MPNMFYSTCVRVAVVLLFISLHQRVLGQSLKDFKSSVYPCSPELLLYRNVLSVAETTPSLPECFVRCILHEDCEASVLQTYAIGTARCTTLSPVLGNLTTRQMPVNLDTSHSCRVVFPEYTCLNGGTLQFATCACLNGFIGERCELVRPSSWHVREWITVVTAHGTASPTYTINNDTINNLLEYSEAKVKTRNSDSSATILVSHMWTANFKSGSRVLSHILLEKSAWNRLTPGGTRTIRYFHFDGSTQDLIFDGNVGSYVFSETEQAYEFLATSTHSFPDQISNDAVNNALLKSVLDDGCGVFHSTFARDTAPKIVLQNAMQQVNLFALKYIRPPPKWICHKHDLGEKASVLRQEMSAGVPFATNLNDQEERSYDPRWLSIGFSSSDEAFVKARGYVLQGQKFRVIAGSDYHDTFDIILYEAKIWFVLSLYMSATDPVPFTTDQDHIVKSIISLDGTRNLCTHVLESESVIRYSIQTGVSVKFSVDARLWTKTFSVYSNSSIAYGSLLDLGQKITSGLDVRFLIQWIHQDRVRLLGTQLNTVKDNGKISSESTLTWRLTDPGPPELRLSVLCDFEYVLVTTDGYMEVATFNVWSPVDVRQETDVLITWFTG